MASKNKDVEEFLRSLRDLQRQFASNFRPAGFRNGGVVSKPKKPSR